jgi:hypothetical protein
VLWQAISINQLFQVHLAKVKRNAWFLNSYDAAFPYLAPKIYQVETRTNFLSPEPFICRSFANKNYNNPDQP